jgi:hypothetical protein
VPVEDQVGYGWVTSEGSADPGGLAAAQPVVEEAGSQQVCRHGHRAAGTGGQDGHGLVHRRLAGRQVGRDDRDPEMARQQLCLALRIGYGLGIA